MANSRRILKYAIKPGHGQAFYWMSFLSNFAPWRLGENILASDYTDSHRLSGLGISTQVVAIHLLNEISLEVLSPKSFL